MQEPIQDQKPKSPALPQKPGRGVIDMDDAMIEPPNDDAFKKSGEDSKDGGNSPR
jgi:hypothetical protein